MYSGELSIYIMKTLDEVLKDDSMKLGMDSADPLNQSNGEGVCQEDLSKSPTHSRRKWIINWI